MTLRVHAAVKSETAKAVAWYEAKQAGLGYDLLASIDDAVGQITESPESGTRLETWRGRGEIRRIILPRFSYMVVYEVEATTIHVLAVAHTSRRPGSWASRRSSN